ncbi:MAG: hypothetical protein HQM10_13915 [Candidatus Riflebacteria bacterium]|nr:hypothetical protein [Candidatus Riflebacteria bacterium]
MRILFEIPENQFSFRVIPVPLYCRAEEMPTLKKLGIQGIFELNLYEMQIIEAPIISGCSKITEDVVNHLLGVTLHEKHQKDKISLAIRKKIPYIRPI